MIGQDMSRPHAQPTQAVWIIAVAAASILFSLGLACATPFPAIATIAGTRMPVRTAAALVTISWLANQLVGYLMLGYPAAWDSFAWGAVIGIAALAAMTAAFRSRRLDGGSPLLVFPFLLAFAAYELVLFAATAVLPSGADAFALPIVGEILLVNIVGLVGLLLLHRVATAIGIVADTTDRRVPG